MFTPWLSLGLDLPRLTENRRRPRRGRLRSRGRGASLVLASAGVLTLPACSEGGTGVGGPIPDPTTGGTTTGEASSESTGSTGGADGTGDESSSTGAPMGSIECGEIPQGAVGAEFDHTPTILDAEGSFDWMMMGLPQGLAVNPLTGEISGTPAASGTFDVDVIATGGTPEQTLEATCTLEIAEGLEVNPSGLSGPCYGPGDDLSALLSGGDGSPVSCSTPGGEGNGAPPEGVSVDPRTCAITGEPDDTFGIWTWITVVEQSGKKLFVPSCIAEEDAAPDTYGITASHGGGMFGVLEPGQGTFTPGEPITYGVDGDPRFEIRGPCTAGACFFGFTYRVGSSPFDDHGLSPSSTLDDNGMPVGFYHGMNASGPAVDPEFADRPFVLNWDIDYCVADSSGPCSPANIQDNLNGFLRFGVIMRPAR